MWHETGHWYGLDHANQENAPVASIMRGTYSATRPWCLAEWNLIQVDNAVDRDWDFRLGSAHGLTYEGES